MMMTSRNDIKDRLIHNQSPYPTKDKVLSYTIPVDHTENLLFCSSSSSSSSSSTSSNSGNSNGQDNGTLNFITADDDPCNGRDSLASFLDEGLGTSLDGVDEIASPIFPTLGRNDSGVFSSDEGTGVPAAAHVGHATNKNSIGTHNHASLIPPSITTNSGSSGNSSCSTSANNNNIISGAEVVSWKDSSSGSCVSGTCTTSKKVVGTVDSDGKIVLSPPVSATISVVTDSVTGIPSIICTSTPVCSSSGSSSKASKLQGGTKSGSGEKGASTKAKDQFKSKSMPLGRQGPQKCTICDKVFSNASALTKHKLTHSDERRHACTTCGKAFKRQDHLNGHMLTHRNKKPFECKSKGCGKSYCDARSLRRHVENRHGHEFLESMNLTSHKQSNKNNHSQSSNASSSSNPQPEPQPELVQFTPIKVEPIENNNNNDDQKMLDCMPVLQPEPQLESSTSLEKISSAGNSLPLPLGPPVLHKVNDNLSPSLSSTASTGIPVVVKRGNVSVFDFDESIEESVPTNISFSTNVNGMATQIKLEKAPAPTPPPIKVSGIQGHFPDMRLIQELAKRFGDSKVALFLASSPTVSGSSTPSIAQIGSIQLDGQNSNGNPTTLAMSGASHAFLPTSESGLFSVTPISIVPTSSGEFTFKPASISMTAGSSEATKPIYIVPSEPLLSTGVNNVNVPQPTSLLPISPPLISGCDTKPAQQSKQGQTGKETKNKNETKGKLKSGIGASLASRIKSKLKAGTLKRLGKTGEKNKAGNDSASPKLSHQSPATTAASSPMASETPSVGQMIMTSQNGGIQTIQITAPGGGGTIATWCESPKDCALNGTEDDRLSESGADGDDKPVECSICCRRFKNTPALNGHMRLHGGYFKKETEGTKKKEVTKEHTHSTPLQTASVSVRALIEEKIKERRNNLLKLAAEKAASESGTSSSPPEVLTSQPQPVPNHPNKSTHKSEKVSSDKTKSIEANNNSSKLSNCPPTLIAQQQMQQQAHKMKIEQVKLNVENSSEKDRNCDQPTIINSNLSINNNINSLTVNSNTITINNNNINNMNPGAAAPSTSSTLGMDPSFHDLSILIGDGGIVQLGMGGNTVNGTVAQAELLLPPNSSRDTLLSQHHLQNSATDATVNNNAFGLQMDKSNFTLLDCGINPEDLCQAFHLIYVDNVGNNGGSDVSLVGDQETIGKVAKLFQEPLPEITSFSSNNIANDNRNSHMKSISEPLIMCPPTSQECNLPWEWRSSTSSDNTDNGSLSTMHDCVGSFLCSSTSDVPDESCTKDPVAGGGYCYTPILSPNSSFCLTPGPDSPFEAGPANQSLSFICPSPSIGSSSVFSDPSVSSLINPPSSVEPIFSPEQHSQPPSVAPQVNITPTAELQKYSHIQQLQGQTEMQNALYASGLENFSQNKQGFVSISQIAPTAIQQPQNNMSLQEQELNHNASSTGCLPAFSTFPTSVMNDLNICHSNGGNFITPKDIVVHCPINGVQPSSLVPFEVFATCPLPRKISEKWINGKTTKKGKIKVGSDFQAEIPAFRGNKARLKSYKTSEEKLWDPNVLDMCSYDEVDNYLEFACCSAVPGGGMNKEYALHLLMLSKGNIREAILRLMEKLPSLPPKLRNYSYAENQRWSSEEIMAFQIALIQAGKDFARISKAVGTKHEKECVSFYYFWKKVCPSEYQVMKQIWKDRLDHQFQQQSTNLHNSLNLLNRSNTISVSNDNMSFLVPAQEFRSISICK